MTEADAKQIERFVIFVRLVHQAKQAGMNQHEAARAIYPDVYPENEPSDNSTDPSHGTI